MTDVTINLAGIPDPILSPDFAAVVVNGVVGADELDLLDAAFEARGLDSLAELMAGIGNYKRTDGSGLEGNLHLRRLVMEQVGRHPAEVRRVLTDLRAVVDGRSFRSIAVARAHVARSLRNETDPVIPPRTEEDRLSGPGWREKVLPHLLHALLMQEKDDKTTTYLLLIDNILLALQSARCSRRTKVVALRVLADHLETIEKPGQLLGVLEGLFSWVEEKEADPLLQSMAWGILKRLGAVGEEARLPLSLNMAVWAPRGFSFRLRGMFMVMGTDWLHENRTRVQALAERLGQLHKPSLKEEGFPYLRWHSVIPEVVGIPVGLSLEERASRARGIFSGADAPAMLRALAIAYYSYLFYPDESFQLSEPEAEAACDSLLKMMRQFPENHLLHTMAMTVYPRVVVNQLRAAQLGRDVRVMERVKGWAHAKASALDQVSSTVAPVKAAKIRQAVERLR